MAKKNKGIAGIFIELDEIVISISNFSNDKINISKLFKIPTEFKYEGVVKPLSLNNEFFSDKQKWFVEFKNLVSKLNLSGFDVVVSLSEAFSITRFFTMPYIDPKFWNKSIPIESKKYIPVSFDEISYDFHVLPLQDSKRLGVLFSLTQRKTVEFLINSFKQMNLNILMIESRLLSVNRFVFSLFKNYENSIFSIIYKDSVYNIFTYKQIPVLFRDVNFSKSAFFSERRSVDIKGSLAFVERIIPDVSYNKVVLITENPDEWADLIKKESNYEVEHVKLQDYANIPESSFTCIAAVGASLKSAVKDKIEIDISEINKEKRTQKLVQTTVFSLTGILAGLIIISLFYSYVKLYFINNEIASYTTQIGDTSDFQGLTAQDISYKIENLHKSVEFMEKLFKQRDFLAPKLSVLSEVIPKDVWIDEITYNSPLNVNPGIENSLQLVINSRTYLKDDAKINVINYFRKKLMSVREYALFNAPAGVINYEVVEEKSEVVGVQSSGIRPSEFRIICQADKSKL